MRNKNVKFIVIAIIVVLLIGLVVSLAVENRKEPTLTLTGKSGYEQAAESLDIDFNADIMVYGEDPGFIEEVKWRRIETISEESMDDGNNHGYRAIVLFDYEGTISVTDEELILIKNYVEDKGYDMFYIGKQYLDDFQRLKFTKGCEPEEISLEYIGSINYGKDVQQNEVGNLYAYHGLWTERDEEQVGDNPDMLRQIMIMTMKDYAREANGIVDEFSE